MTIKFSCAECAASYDVDDDLAGKTIKCRECQGYNRVALMQRNDGKAEPKPAAKPLLSARGSAMLDADPSPSLTIRYRCPFCNSDQAPLWRYYWTPTSTLVALVLLPPFLSLLVFAAVAIGLLTTTPVAAAETFMGKGAAWLLLISIPLGILLWLAAAFLLQRVFTPFIEERRQVCPDCHVRLS